MSYKAPSIPQTEKEILQPLVDHAINALVTLGLKRPVWAKRDRLSDEWHYVMSKLFDREVYGTRYGYRMLPDDPRWQEIIELAIARQVELGARTIKPIGSDSQLYSFLEDARDDFLASQEPSEAS